MVITKDPLPIDHKNEKKKKTTGLNVIKFGNSLKKDILIYLPRQKKEIQIFTTRREWRCM